MHRKWLLRLALVLLFGLALTLVWVLTYRPPVFPPPLRVALGATNTSLSVSPGLNGILFVFPDGSLWRWGGWLAGRTPVPERIGTNTHWRNAMPGNNGFVGIQQDGTLWQAGWIDARNLNRDRPRQVGHASNWVAVTKVDAAAAALASDGSLWTWGDSMQAGSLGDGAVASRLTPGQVGTNRWRALASAGSNYGFLAEDTAGEIWAWGKPHQPGPMFATPTRILSGANWTIVDIRTFLTSDGTVWVGPAFWNQGIANNSSILPVLRGGTPGSVGVADHRVYHVDSQGALWAQPLPIPLWKSEPATSALPVRIGERSDWVRLWSAAGSVVGLTRDGTLWTWGVDWGQEPVLDTMSRVRKGIHEGLNKACELVGIARVFTGLQTSASLPTSDTPRPLVVLEFPEPE